MRQEAELLKKRFHDAFWCEEISTYAIALDGNKQRCQVRSSNAGHTLFSGIVSESHADRIIAELGSENYFSGWGIRTIAAGEARYNPMSYHNGSVWPHDNALISYGLQRTKNKALAVEILSGLFDASIFLESHRCLSYSVALRNAMEWLLHFTLWPAHPRLGQQALFFWCFKPAWEWRSWRLIASCVSSIRCCPNRYPRCEFEDCKSDPRWLIWS